MGLFDRIFHGFQLPDALAQAPGPSPWYPLLQGPTLRSATGTLIWRSAGDEAPNAGKILLVDPLGATRLILDFHCHVRQLEEHRFLVWYVRALERRDGIVLRSEVVLAIFDADDLEAITSIGQAQDSLAESGGYFSASRPLAQKVISTDLPAGEHAIILPGEFAAVGELLLLVHSTEPGSGADGWSRMNLTLWELDPSAKRLRITPQDWFNKGDYDFGYQWPTRIARDPRTGALLGEAIRIGLFELDESRRQVRRWLHKDVFFQPSRLTRAS